MTIGEFLQTNTATLQQAGIATARLDCLVLLEDTLGVGRSNLLAHPEMVLTTAQQTILDAYISERIHHQPLAYIRGKAEFYGRTFSVNSTVLVPRPETEAIIDLLKELLLKPDVRIADIGTGSGCLAITAALELPQAQLTGYDISPTALQVARNNAQNLGANVSFQISDLLQDVPPQDILLANLPYVPDHFPVNKAAMHEPKLALFSGADGLTHYKIFWQQIATATQKPQFVLTEALPEQHHALAQLARHAGFVQDHKRGLVQLFARD
ncbi:MAG TPA: peptide chain release factor N(5)-glutamine methyltransferase [Candidatus Saccharimonadales bacterium]|nr:peptide chain release factor N(5)-glutamine methyltransferase [Candidatus Saccharimonadales bacterium]